MASFLLVTESEVRSEQSPLLVSALPIRCTSSLGKKLTCVCVEVGLEHAGWNKRSSAQLTRVRLLPGVGAHVLLQVAWLFKTFITPVAPENGKKSGCFLLPFVGIIVSLGRIKHLSLTCRLSCCCPRCCSDSRVFLWLTEVRSDCSAGEAHWSKSQRTQTGITQWH